jgi:hypothetical protein
MNMEAQATATPKGEGEEKRAAFEGNAARAAEIQKEIAEAAATGDFAKIAELSAEGQQLKSANESVVAEDHQEGLEMNAEFDAEKARQEAEEAKAVAEAAAEQARFAQEAAEKAATDQSAAEKLAEEIKSGSTKMENVADGGQLVEAAEKNETAMGNAQQGINSLLGKSNYFDPFANRGMGAVRDDIDQVRQALEAAGALAQEELAEDFFNKTASQLDTRRAYVVYGALKGTAFSRKFRELENERLVSQGYSEFTL